MTVHNRKKLDALIRSTPGFFLGHMLPIIEGKPGFRQNWHVHAMSNMLINLFNGDIRHLILNTPPRSLKSSIGAVYFIPWLLGKNPTTKIILVTYNEDYCTQLARLCKQVLDHKAYKRLFPHVQLLRDNIQATRLRTTQGGSVHFTSFHGSLTGLGADYIIVDDPVKTTDARSDLRLQDVELSFREAVYSRLNNPKTGRILILMQRVHPNDLCGALTATPDHPWQVLTLPVQFRKTRIFDLGFGHTHTAREGDILDPGQFNQAAITNRLQTLGVPAFEAQYQQEPFIDNQNLVDFRKLAHINPRDIIQNELNDPYRLHSWDTALTAGSRSDYSAITKWTKYQGKYILIGAAQYRITSDKLQSLITKTAISEGAHEVLIEHANHAHDLIHAVRKASNQRFTVKAISTGGRSKEDRLACELHKINMGTVFLLRDGKGIELFLSQLRQFPNGKHDDLVDSFTQALKVMGKSSSKPIWHIS